MKKILLHILFVLLFLFPTQSMATTKWISTTGTAAWGDCNSDCDANELLCCSLDTLEANDSSLSGGDTVTFKEGTYQGADANGWIWSITNVTGSGTYITFQCESKWGCTIDGEDVTNDHIYAVYISHDTDSNYLIFDGFEIIQANKGFFLNDQAGDGDLEYITIKNCYIHDLYYFATAYCDANSCPGNSCATGISLGEYSDHITIEKNVFGEKGRQPDPGCEGVRDPPCYACIHDYNHDAHIGAAGRYHTIQNNIFYGNIAGYSVKIMGNSEAECSGSCYSAKVVNNTFHGDDNPQRSGAILFYKNSNQTYQMYGVVIANNVFHQPNDGDGPDCALFQGNAGETSCPDGPPYYIADASALHLHNNVTNSQLLTYPCTEAYITSQGGTVSGNTKLNNRSSDMGMTDPTNHVFTLTEDANYLIGGANATHLPSDDFLGVPRPLGTGGLGDVGAYEFGPWISGQYPTSLQPCDNGSSTDTVGMTSSDNADCKYSEKGVDTCSTAFADLDNSFTGGEGGTSHTFSSTVNCDASKTYVVMCRESATDIAVGNCLEIIHDVAAGEQEPPLVVPPGAWQGGGDLIIEGGGNKVIGQ